MWKSERAFLYMDHAANEALTTEIGGVDIKSGQSPAGTEDCIKRSVKTACYKNVKKLWWVVLT
jgi:hypothetical protein